MVIGMSSLGVSGSHGWLRLLRQTMTSSAYRAPIVAEIRTKSSEEISETH
jgi:hypothetical protein